MEKDRTTGVFLAFFSYLIWGLTPIYWKLFSTAGSFELLCHRIIWAFFISVAMIFIGREQRNFIVTLKDKKSIFWIVFRTVLLAVNWYVYLWAMGHGRVLEASLGYYLNPLVSIFLGVIFLNERLSKLGWFAVAFAAAGVAAKTFLVGHFPVVSVALAFSFGLYGLLKKKSSERSIVGMTMEAMFMFPFALFYFFKIESNGTGTFIASNMQMKLLFVTTGIITVLPLTLFAKGVKSIPLTWIGFLQFIAPTLMLFSGLFLYKENFSVYELSGFVLVWLGIFLFLISALKKKKT
ncbi:MAG: EamA family transporter RarD [Spirochaetales bacterium]|nr:EamA family transporter RarD [Spirochaetales bacterium]